MKRLILIFSMLVCFITFSHAQTTADFVFTAVCFGDSITFTSTSTTSNTILSQDWDIDSNGLFDNASGAVVTEKLLVYKSYLVGLQVITDVDTAVIYKQVDFLPQPVAAFSVDFQRQCLTSNFFTFSNHSTLTSGLMSFFWNLDNGLTSTQSDTSLIYFTAGTFDVKLVVTTDQGCKDSVTHPIYVISDSEADFMINDTAQCLLGNGFEFTENALLCDALISFSWDLDGDGVFGEEPNESIVNHVFTTPGVYQIGLHIITASDTDSVYKTVYVHPTPSVDYNFTSDTAQCLTGNSFSVNNLTVLGGPGTLTYEWSFGNIQTSTHENPIPYSYDASGYYHVKLTATSDQGCKDSVTYVAHVYPQPNVAFSLTDTFGCVGTTFNFVNNSSITSPWSLYYIWDFGDGDTAHAINPSHSYSAAGVYDVTLYAISDSGCFDMFTRKINVISGTVARINIPDTMLCVYGGGFQLTNASINCYPLVTVRWDTNNDGVFDNGSGTLLNLIYTAPGVYPVGMKIVTTMDSAIVYRNVYVIPTPVASFTVNNNVQPLAGNNFVFTNTSTITPVMGLSYIWYYGDGDTSHQENPSHTYSALGSYSVKLVVESAMGCLDSVTQSMQVFSAVGVDFIADEVCFGDSTTLTDNSSTSDPIVSIDWDLNNDGSFNNANGASIKFLFAAPGDYLVGLQVSTTATTESFYKTVRVFERASVDFLAGSNNCQGQLTLFQDNSTTIADTITKFLWDFDNNGIVDDSSGPNTSYLYTLGGTKLVGLTVVTHNGCRSSIVKPISVNYQPVADFSVTNVCEKDSAWFTDNSSIFNDSIINLLWDYGDGNDAIIHGAHPHYYDLAGQYTVTLIALTDKGCRDTAVKVIDIYPRPVVTLDFSGPTAIYENQDVTITALGTYVSALWTTGATTNSITVNQEGSYGVTITDINGCRDSTSAYVSIIEVAALVINDVITPNGDNINDYLIVYDLPYFAPVVINIYNRWGDLIYTSDDYKNDWDAKRNGKALPEGAYYYILKTRQGNTYKGTVNVIR